jgi:hypothetical protein
LPGLIHAANPDYFSAEIAMPVKTKKHLCMVLIALVVAGFLFLLFAKNHPNPNAGTDHSASTPHSSTEDDTIGAWYKRINDATTSDQFNAIAREVMATAPAEAINSLMESLFDRWIEKDPAAALDFAGRIEAESLLEALTGRLLYTEGAERILRLAELVNDEAVKARVMRMVLAQWAQQDISAALSWMNTQVLPPALDDMKASLLARLTKQNPQEAGVLIRNMQAGHGKNTAARNYAATLAGTDIREAMSWAASLDDADAYGIALTAVYEAWFQTEPDKKLIMEQVLAESDSGLRDRLINEIALDIASMNPAELAAMVERLPETSQPDVAEKAVRFWKERDSAQALNWVKSLAPGPVKDRGSKVMVEDLLLKDDRQGAFSLAMTIGDNRVRYEAVKTVVQHWYAANPAEARQILDGNSLLSEAEKAGISSHIQQRQ